MVLFTELNHQYAAVWPRLSVHFLSCFGFLSSNCHSFGRMAVRIFLMLLQRLQVCRHSLVGGLGQNHTPLGIEHGGNVTKDTVRRMETSTE